MLDLPEPRDEYVQVLRAEEEKIGQENEAKREHGSDVPIQLIEHISSAKFARDSEWESAVIKRISCGGNRWWENLYAIVMNNAMSEKFFEAEVCAELEQKVQELPKLLNGTPCILVLYIDELSPTGAKHTPFLICSAGMAGRPEHKIRLVNRLLTYTGIRFEFSDKSADGVDVAYRNVESLHNFNIEYDKRFPVFKDKLNVAKDFTTVPLLGRRDDGDLSGQEFREDYLVAPLSANRRVTLNLDGTCGYSAAFLEHAFGGLAKRFDLKEDQLEDRLQIVSTDPMLLEEIRGYIFERYQFPVYADPEA